MERALVETLRTNYVKLFLIEEESLQLERFVKEIGFKRTVKIRGHNWREWSEPAIKRKRIQKVQRIGNFRDKKKACRNEQPVICNEVDGEGEKIKGEYCDEAGQR